MSNLQTEKIPTGIAGGDQFRIERHSSAIQKSAATHYSLCSTYRKTGVIGVGWFAVAFVQRVAQKFMHTCLPDAGETFSRRAMLRIFRALAEHDVRYLVVGGTGMAMLGLPRPLTDLDIIVSGEMDNARRLLVALRACGIAEARIATVEEVTTNDVLFFSSFVKLDSIINTMGLKFNDAWPRRKVVAWNGVPCTVAAAEDIIANKAAFGRPKDLEDIAHLNHLIPSDRKSARSAAEFAEDEV